MPETTNLYFAFCGIARPAKFFTELGKAGVRVVATHAFRDHHAYTATDVELLFNLAQAGGATALVTTEKDAVNLGEFADRLHPLHVVPVQMEFEALPDRESPAVSREEHDVATAGRGRVLQRRAEMTVRE